MLQALESSINQGLVEDIRELTETLLRDIFHNADANANANANANADANTDTFRSHISQFNELLIQTHNKNPALAYHILVGLMVYLHRADSHMHKILLNDLAMKTLNQFIETHSWSVLKPCIIIMRTAFKDKVINEPLFQHLVVRITQQLTADALTLMADTQLCSSNLCLSNLCSSNLCSSNLCYYLPREKSYTWGWFAHFLANAYYGLSENTKKHRRKNLMKYRKLLTYLRRYTEPPVLTESMTEPTTPEPAIEPATLEPAIEPNTIEPAIEEKNDKSNYWFLKWLGW
jgi:hypothetical protein